MSSNRHEKSQMKILASALVVSLIVIIVAGYFIAKSIQGNKNISGGYVQKSSDSTPDISEPTTALNSNADSDNTFVADSSSVAEKAEVKKAVDYMDYTTDKLLDDFGRKYENFGYYEGGYFIYNSEKFPYMYFSVVIDNDHKLVNDKIQAIVIMPNGCVEKDVVVGASYDDLKKIYGDKIKCIDGSEHNCARAEVDYKDYTVYFDFDTAANVSTIATVKTNAIN